jgi:hypothetical protein
LLQTEEASMRTESSEAGNVRYIGSFDAPVPRDESIARKADIGCSADGIREISILGANERCDRPSKIDEVLNSAA